MMRIGVSLYHPDQAAEALREYAASYPTLGPQTSASTPRFKSTTCRRCRSCRPKLVGAPHADADLDVGWRTPKTRAGQGTHRPARVRSARRPSPPLLCCRSSRGVQHLIDEEFSDGHRYYTKEAHLKSLTDEAIDILVQFFRDMPMGGEGKRSWVWAGADRWTSPRRTQLSPTASTRCG